MLGISILFLLTVKKRVSEMLSYILITWCGFVVLTVPAKISSFSSLVFYLSESLNNETKIC